MITKSGINAASTSVLATESNYHTLLSKRFDRTDQGKRIHFASAMSLLGLTDGDNTGTGNGYLDIVDFILQSCTDVEPNLQELYRRVAFYICVGNTDDHFRNHGFLLSSKGWTLSPAYDINPTLNSQQSLLISSASCDSDLNILFNASDDYMLLPDTAIKIIEEVATVMKGWRQLALRLQIPKSEIDLFSHKLDRFIAWKAT